jgi:hypothetical protein
MVQSNWLVVRPPRESGSSESQSTVSFGSAPVPANAASGSMLLRLNWILWPLDVCT